MASSPLYRRTRAAAVRAGATPEEARAQALAAVESRDAAEARDAARVLASQEGDVAAEAEAWLAEVTDAGERTVLALAGYRRAGGTGYRALSDLDWAALEAVASQEGLGARPVPTAVAGTLRAVAVAPVATLSLPRFHEDEVAAAEPDAVTLLDSLLAVGTHLPVWDPARGLSIHWADGDTTDDGEVMTERSLHRATFRDLLADWLSGVFAALVARFARWRRAA
ncbi:hypothetical protein [Nocardioides sp. KR10-350]|uniref:hypothetical protein n=1 Tax=Nocardioides cheoyonin TaxID=3156615 RepID=UPI0032B59130